MPDGHMPPAQRGMIRVMRALIYLLLLLAGVSGALLLPKAAVGTLGAPLTYWWATLLALGSLASITGVAFGRYRIEWLATWPTIGGSMIYALSIWSVVLEGTPGYVTQALLVSALTLAIVARSVELSAHAAVLRKEHTESRRAFTRPGEGGRG